MRNSGEDVEKEKASSLFMRVQIGLATLEMSMQNAQNSMTKSAV